MADSPPPRPTLAPTGDQYTVELTRPLPSVGPLAAFAATGQNTGRSDLMAIRAQRHLPPRPRVLQALASPIDGLLTPLAHVIAPAQPGSAEEACYVVCAAPRGPGVLARPRPWPEAELLEYVLRPAALVLEQLRMRGVTHRGIRTDNVFQMLPGQPVVLGTAWAAPAGVGQPALFEPPYSAMCLAAGRGDGTIADDVYSLGVLLVCLGLGHAPMVQLDDAAIIRRKLELGSFAALTDGVRLSPAIGDLARGMLAEDPEHRPPPSLLLDPASARGRRVAARPPRRAQRPMPMAGAEVWDARSLAYAIAVAPEPAVHALRSGAAVQWMRRAVGDVTTAARLEDLVRHRVIDAQQDDADGDAALAMRAVAVLDPLAPLCWRGLALWPDGIGTSLAAAQATESDADARLQDIVVLELAGSWAALRPERCDAAALRVEARQQHAWLQVRGAGVSGPRLCYILNPLQPCASKLAGGRWVTRLPELLQALDDAAGRVDRKQSGPMDADVAAFIAARSERQLQSELMVLAGGGPEDAVYLALLRVLAQLQSRYHGPPLPGLAVWLAERAGPALGVWRNRQRRAVMAERLQELVKGGQLAPMLAVLDDPVGRGVDAHEAQQSMAEIGRIDAELAQAAAGADDKTILADRIGQEIAAGIGLAALAAVLAVAALG